jgi:hypothetical protein
VLASSVAEVFDVQSLTGKRELQRQIRAAARDMPVAPTFATMTIASGDHGCFAAAPPLCCSL